MCVCVCVCVLCVRKVHDASAQERLIHVLLHTVLLWHTLQCVLVYGVQNGTLYPPIA